MNLFFLYLLKRKEAKRAMASKRKLFKTQSQMLKNLRCTSTSKILTPIQDGIILPQEISFEALDA